MKRITLSLGDLVVFRVKGEDGEVKIGIRDDSDYSNDVYYYGKIYHDSQISFIEYGSNNGEDSTLYRAVANAYPSYVTKHPEDMVDYILRKSLKPNELAKVEREYNKILNNKGKTGKGPLFGRR